MEVCMEAAVENVVRTLYIQQWIEQIQVDLTHSMPVVLEDALNAGPTTLFNRCSCFSHVLVWCFCFSYVLVGCCGHIAVSINFIVFWCVYFLRIISTLFLQLIFVKN